MDEQVDMRFQEADWFLERLMSLRDSYATCGGIAHIYDPENARDLLVLKSCVDGFLFVLVSAKDMLIQEVKKRVPDFHHNVKTTPILAEIGNAKSASPRDSKYGWYARLTH